MNLKKITMLSVMLASSVVSYSDGISLYDKYDNKYIASKRPSNNINVFERGDLEVKSGLNELDELVEINNKGNKEVEKESQKTNSNNVSIAKNSPLIVKNILKYANSLKGVKYIWGGTDVNKGLDCSAFNLQVFKKVGIKLPRVSRHQYKYSKKIPNNQAQVGDLVFFKTTKENVVSHTGIYLGKNKFIHASSKGGKVMISELSGYYKDHFVGFGRVLK